MHADKFNRFALTLLGLLLLMAGAATMALSTGLFGTSYSHHALFDNFISRWIGAHGDWLWPVVAVVAALIVLAALRWVLTLLVSTDRSGAIDIPGQRKRGRTELKSNALTTALSAEIESYHGVDTAKARALGDAAAPRLIVQVSARRGTDVADLRARIEGEALAHARAALERDELPIRLDISMSSKQVKRTAPSTT